MKNEKIETREGKQQAEEIIKKVLKEQWNINNIVYTTRTETETNYLFEFDIFL